jgi:hypothetical protein
MHYLKIQKCSEFSRVYYVLFGVSLPASYVAQYENKVFRVNNRVTRKLSWFKEKQN